MLILTRKPGEATRINSDIGVTILGVKGSQVRLGIQAPAGVSVHRQEIFDRIQAQGGSLPATEHAAIDPVDLFIEINPSGLSDEHLIKGRGSFVDACTRAHYAVFLAGYNAAQGGRP